MESNVTHDFMASMIFLGFALLIAKAFLNSVYPGLFGKLFRGIGKTLGLTLKILLWPLGYLLSKLLKPLLKKKLPGRRR